MTLKEYMKLNDHTFRSLGAELGIHHSQLCRYVKGKYLPNMKEAFRIKEMTGGQVTFEDWFKEQDSENDKN